MPLPDVRPSRVLLTDLQPWSTSKVTPPPTGLVDVVALATAPTIEGGLRGANLALRADGTVVGWGASRAGETTPPAGLDNVVGLDISGGFALALRADGRVVGWGGDASTATAVPADLAAATQVAALGQGGCGFGVALRADGTVTQWGGAGTQTCANPERFAPPAGLSDVVEIAAGIDAAVALREDGTVVAWGPATTLRRDGVPLAEWTDVVAVDTQSGTFLGVRADHTAVAYGVWGEAGAPGRLPDVVGVAAGATAALLRSDGSATLWPTSFPAGPTGPFQRLATGPGYVLGIAAAAPDPDPLPGPAVGTDEIGPNLDTNPAGMAEAFSVTAHRDLVATRFHVYLDEQSKARHVVVGVYADRNGEPGRLLASGLVQRPVAGAWNSAAIGRLPVREGQQCWLAILAPRGSGQVYFRDQPAYSGGATVTSAQRRLSLAQGLPTRWRTGQTFGESPASMFLT